MGKIGIIFWHGSPMITDVVAKCKRLLKKSDYRKIIFSFRGLSFEVKPSTDSKKFLLKYNQSLNELDPNSVIRGEYIHQLTNAWSDMTDDNLLYTQICRKLKNDSELAIIFNHYRTLLKLQNTTITFIPFSGY